MVNRPLKDKRPLGPFIDVGDDDSTVEQSTTEPQQTEGQPASTDTRGEDKKPYEIDDPILQTAEEWYQSIAKEENKRKMMRNYFRSISNLSDEEIENKLDEAGL